MELGLRAGIETAETRLTPLGKAGKCLLVKRFDINATGGRNHLVSMQTLLRADDYYNAGYHDLAEVIRHISSQPAHDLYRLYRQMIFNVLIGNTDDHPRNHAAFWDGQTLTLTPAYDICPQGRTGNEASQAMLITEDNRMSRISSCLDAAPHFLLSRLEATTIVENQLNCIIDHWHAACEEAALTPADSAFLWGRQFLNPYAFEDLDGDTAHLKNIADHART